VPIAIILPEPPEGAENTCQPVKLWVLVLSVALTILSAIIYMAIFVSGQGFRDLFQGFGADLPALTHYFLIAYQYFGLLIMIGLIPCVLLLWNRNCPVVQSNRLFTIVVASFALSMFLLSVSVIAAYLPIFKLGAVV
jgi:hypothetical protein